MGWVWGAVPKGKYDIHACLPGQCQSSAYPLLQGRLGNAIYMVVANPPECRAPALPLSFPPQVPP